MKIKKTYLSFLIKEAKINASNDLIDALDIISNNTPKDTINWAERMKSLIGTEVNTNINYLSTSDNPDMVKWKPDDKTKNTYLIWLPSKYYKSATEVIGGRMPEGIAIGRILRKLTPIESARLLKGDISALQDAQFDTHRGFSILHMEFKDRKGKSECFISEKYCKLSSDSVPTQDYRMGKLFKSLMNAAKWSPSHEEVDKFHTEYVNAVKKMKKMDLDRFEIVEGEDIRKYYLESSYDGLKHTLGTSCMRHAKCQPYFDLYVQNPENIKLLILRSKNDPSKICGRALLWQNINYRSGDDFEYKWGMKEWSTKANFMDRIFVNNSKDEGFFKEWAVTNGYLFKKSQDYSPNPIQSDINTIENVTLWIELKSKTPKSGLFPYIDTMCNYQPENGVLTNIGQDWCDIDWKQLHETNGGDGSCPECGGTGRSECPECDGDGSCDLCGGSETIVCSRCGR
jgi:hypothetical protein